MRMEKWIVQTLVFFIGVWLVAAVDIRLPPSIEEGPDVDLYIYRPGGKKTLQCRAIGRPTPEYSWWHNGIHLDENLHFVHRLRHTDGDIEITLESGLGEGTYQCEASNQYGIARSRTATLRQARQPSESASHEADVKEVQEGEPFRIERSPGRWYPHPSFEWKTGKLQDKDQTDYILGPRVQLDGETGDLHFAYAQMSDQLPDDEVYKCVVYNPHLDLRAGGSYTKLIVHPKAGEVERFAPRLAFATSSPHVALEGQSTTLRCFFSGNPAPSLSWSKREGSLPSRGRYTLNSYRSELTIMNLTQSDEGVYVCRGSNQRTRMNETSIHLDVQAAPRFLDKDLLPRNVNVTVGQNITFRCDAYAEPSAHITWMQNAQPLDPNNLPRKLRLSGDRRELTIADLCKDCERDLTDLQVIQCNASNIHGYDFAAGYVNVIERTELIEKGDVEQTVGHNDEAEMNFLCTGTSDDSTPVTATWYKQEVDDNTGEVYELRVYNRSDKLWISDLDTTLTIKLPANDSEGWAEYGGRYLCRVSNGYSSDERLIIINVVDIPPPDTGEIHQSSVLDLWWIFLIIVLLLLLVLISCCICLMRGRGDTYSVDDKERQNGNNPEKELLDHDFQTYCRPSDAPVKPSVGGSVGGSVRSLVSDDDDTASIEGYGDVDVGKYNEDGSFVGAYTGDQPTRQRGRTASRNNAYV